MYAAYADLAVVLAVVLGCPSGVEQVFVLRPSRAGSQAPQGDPDDSDLDVNRINWCRIYQEFIRIYGNHPATLLFWHPSTPSRY